MDKKDIQAIIDRQGEYFKAGKMRNAKNRVESLKRLYKNIKLMLPEIAEALKIDLNKCEMEAYMSEIGMVLSETRHMIKHCKHYAKPHRVTTPLAHFHSKSYKLPSAYGCVLVMSPWNYPFLLSIDPIIDAVAAGNSVILKSSESSIHTTREMAKLIEKTFERGHVDVVLGSHDDCNYLLDQEFDYIFFTGSSRIGKMVMQKASEHFTPVTLELGGKSPCIVDKDANISLSAKRIVWGKFLNCGQTCVAPDYIYCHESVKEQLVKEIERQIVLQYTTDPLRNNDYPKMINERRFNAVVSLIDKGKVLFGGKVDKDKLKIEPTLVDATFDDDVMQEEIFGPVLPFVTFKDIDEVISKVNSMSTPLALYIFSNNKKVQDKVLAECHFGGGCVNDTVIHLASSNLGFGGLKQSGIGAYHGRTGFDTFTHYKSIVDKKNWIDLPLRYQPVSKFKYWLIKLFLR
ncbi:MAG: aldehyde dehydrogenase [Clostridia bacterium]|nr:aldehyde dehydrogenase [Clostridia bacterium]